MNRSLRMMKYEAGEMTQRLGALTTLGEDLHSECSQNSYHLEHNYQELTLVSGDSGHSSECYRHNTHMCRHSHIHRK